MFKVGDKGKTRAEGNYVITRIDLSNYFGPWHQPVFASIDGGHERCFGVDGAFNPCYPDNDFDLMPPESHEEVEMPECEDEVIIEAGDWIHQPCFEQTVLLDFLAWIQETQPDVDPYPVAACVGLYLTRTNSDS